MLEDVGPYNIALRLGYLYVLTVTGLLNHVLGNVEKNDARTSNYYFSLGVLGKN